LERRVQSRQKAIGGLVAKPKEGKRRPGKLRPEKGQKTLEPRQ